MVWQLPRPAQLGYMTAVMLCDVMQGHQIVFANSFESKRATAPLMVSLCSADQNASNDMHFNPRTDGGLGHLSTDARRGGGG